MIERVPVVNGRTYYFYVAKTGTDVTPLSNPFSVTLTRLPAETGENCGSPIPVTFGENTVSWTASQRDHFYQAPACANGASFDGPDIVLSYTAAFNGYVEFKIEKPDATRWVAMVTGGSGVWGSVVCPRLRLEPLRHQPDRSDGRERNLQCADRREIPPLFDRRHNARSNPLANPLEDHADRDGRAGRQRGNLLHQREAHHPRDEYGSLARLDERPSDRHAELRRRSSRQRARCRFPIPCAGSAARCR